MGEREHAPALHQGAIPNGNFLSVTYLLCLDLVELIRNAFLRSQVEYKVDGRHIYFHPKKVRVPLRGWNFAPHADSMPNSS